MGRHKSRMTGQHGLKRREDGALDRADVRNDRARLERRRDGAPDRLIGADGRAEDHAIGLAHRSSQIVGDEIAKRKRLRPFQHPNRLVGEDDTPRGVAPARGARDRRADQPDANDCKLFEDRLGERLPEPLNHLRPA